MKKLFVESYVKSKDGRVSEDHYECESFSFGKKDGWDSIRLDNVNSVKGSKKKEFSKGKYIVVEKMPHWSEFRVVVSESGSGNVVMKFEG